MSFSVRCGTCHEPISKHLLIREKGVTRTVCPEEHLAKWLNKWDWKFLKKNGEMDFERAQKAWERVVARLPKVGMSHGTRRPKPGSKAKRFPRTACGFCGVSLTHAGAKTDKKYKLLCHKCAKRVEKAREAAKKMGRDPTMGRDSRLRPNYYVTLRFIYKNKPLQNVIHVHARNAHEAKEKAIRRLSKRVFLLSAFATKIRR